MNPSLQGYYV